MTKTTEKTFSENKTASELGMTSIEYRTILAELVKGGRMSLEYAQCLAIDNAPLEPSVDCEILGKH
jgi:hypothetical protein